VSRLSIPLVGVKGMKKLNINTVKEFWAFRNTKYVIGQNLHDYKLENTVFISFLMKELNVIDIKENLDDEVKTKVAMTGKYDKMNRKELISLIEQIGNEFVSSVTKDTDILLCEDVNGTSSKLVKAKKNGIKLISYQEFLKKENRNEIINKTTNN
jgi:NAD-dependent DNA ligase